MQSSLSTGIDIIEIERIKQAVNTWHEAFLNRVFTRGELELCKGDPSRLAGRFAAKEAVLKTLSPYMLTCNWKEIEILASASGRPVLELSGRAVDEFNRKVIKNMDISISHCRQYAVAVAVSQC